VILVIDTSARVAVIATLNGEHADTFVPARSTELTPTLRRIAASTDITKVAVGTGPGSFTGLRVGVSFGLGLAMGLGVPIVPLPSLELLAARSETPATAVIDAGRGRFYFLVPGRRPALGEASDIPRSHPIVDSFRPEKGLRSFSEAAEVLLRTAREVPYRNLEIQYMQSFSPKR